MNTLTEINNASAKLTQIFTDAADISLKKRRKPNKHKPKNKNWFDTDLKSMRYNLISYGKVYSKYPKDPFVKNHFYRLYREYNKSRKMKQKMYKNNLLNEIETLHEDNPKLYWRLINDLQGKTHDLEDNCISSSAWLQHFQGLNNVQDQFLPRIQFLEKKLKEAEKIPCFNELDFPITECEISAAICSIKSNKSPGLDNITNNMLKCSHSTLLLCFKKLFNACLTSGIYPKCWAEGYITPLHKAKDPYDPNNYRGLTITSSIGKLFNRILNSRLDKFLIKHHIIDDCQIGFTKKARTSDHMFVLKTLIDKYCSMTNGRLYACFVDFQKAFDTVIHTGIKLKLLEMGVGSLFYNIINSMYAVSNSCIKVNGELTDNFPVMLGVKQGDNLSPNLFKIFINDLTKYLQNTADPVVLNNRSLHCLLYADDVILLSKSPEGLQSKIDMLHQYCQNWCLTVNTNKTKVLIFNKAGKYISHDFIFNNVKLECVNKYKYLGIHFCASGSFSFTQDELYKKALKAYFKLSKDFLSLHPSVKTSTHVFDHTIKPILLYGCEIWGMFNPLSSKFRNDIISFDQIYSKCPAEKLHQKFCKYILGVHSKTTNIAVLSELGRFPLYFNIIKAMLKFFHRLENPGTTFPLLKDSLAESKALHDSKKTSWYTSIKYILQKINTSRPVHKHNSEIYSKCLRSFFIQEWEQLLNSYASGKLCSYVLFKNNFGCEKYLTIIQNFELRRSLTRLRLSAHTLTIERGRYQGIPRHNRVCPRCSSGEIEDEIHFLFSCTHLNDGRKNLMSQIYKNCAEFMNLDIKNKFVWLMNCENKDILLELCSYIKTNEKCD